MMGIKPKSKLSLMVDPTWVGGNGYRPVRVVLSNAPAAPAVADRNFRVEITPRGPWYGGDEPLTVKAFLTIPQGSASTEEFVSVPHGGMWSMMHIEVYEDGRNLRDMPLDVNLVSNNGGPMTAEGIPSFLVIDRDAPTRARRLVLKQTNYAMGPGGTRPVSTYDLPDVRTLASLNGYGNVYYTGSQVDDVTLLQNLYSMPNVELLPPNDLSDKWLDYTCFDVTVLTLGELRFMQEKHPKQFAALRDWVAAGATLVVFGAGQNFENLGDVEKVLDMPSTKPGEKPHPDKIWAAPNVRTYNANFRFDDGNRGQVYYGPGGAMTMVAPSMPPGGPTNVPEGFMIDQNGQLVPNPSAAVISELPNLRIRELQLGRVMAVSTSEPFPGTTNQWSWICQSIGKSNLNWHSRHGVSLTSSNTDYWDFLIPGVGMAPATGFRILISLFVILIGPVNYWLLRRSRRLYLMLVTVPGGAAFVTLCLLGYALVTDGLGVRARLRSYTHLDQRTGSAVSWSRQSYYAGLAPSRGMVYPDDTAVYRIEDGRFDMGSQSRTMSWKDRRQNLHTGFITSRITAQYLVVRAHHKTPSRVEVTESPGGSKPPQIENRLGTMIHQIAVCDSQGDWYLAEEVESGKAVETTKAAAADSMGEIRKLIAENPPEEPPGFSPNNNNYYGSRWGRRRYYSYAMSSRNGQLPPTMRTSLLEMALRVAGPAGTAPLAPRTYMAVVEKSPEVPLGVDSAREEASLHVVVGQW